MTLNGTFFGAREFGPRHLVAGTSGSIVDLGASYASTGGPGFAHEDVTADIQSNLERTNDEDVCQPALRVGRLRELGWAATFLASPYAQLISGHTLVVDGANWQRRLLTNPPMVTVRDQMGNGPFEA